MFCARTIFFHRCAISSSRVPAVWIRSHCLMCSTASVVQGARILHVHMWSTVSAGWHHARMRGSSKTIVRCRAFLSPVQRWMRPPTRGHIECPLRRQHGSCAMNFYIARAKNVAVTVLRRHIMRTISPRRFSCASCGGRERRGWLPCGNGTVCCCARSSRRHGQRLSLMHVPARLRRVLMKRTRCATRCATGYGTNSCRSCVPTIIPQ